MSDPHHEIHLEHLVKYAGRFATAMERIALAQEKMAKAAAVTAEASVVTAAYASSMQLTADKLAAEVTELQKG